MCHKNNTGKIYTTNWNVWICLDFDPMNQIKISFESNSIKSTEMFMKAFQCDWAINPINNGSFGFIQNNFSLCLFYFEIH